MEAPRGKMRSCGLTVVVVSERACRGAARTPKVVVVDKSPVRKTSVGEGMNIVTIQRVDMERRFVPSTKLCYYNLGTSKIMVYNVGKSKILYLTMKRRN